MKGVQALSGFTEGAGAGVFDVADTAAVTASCRSWSWIGLSPAGCWKAGVATTPEAFAMVRASSLRCSARTSEIPHSDWRRAGSARMPYFSERFEV